jgi:ABC-type Zn2+ transport system substrate-binding protein/surface adhesin
MGSVMLAFTLVLFMPKLLQRAKLVQQDINTLTVKKSHDNDEGKKKEEDKDDDEQDDDKKKDKDEQEKDEQEKEGDVDQRPSALQPANLVRP